MTVRPSQPCFTCNNKAFIWANKCPLLAALILISAVEKMRQVCISRQKCSIVRAKMQHVDMATQKISDFVLWVDGKPTWENNCWS